MPSKDVRIYTGFPSKIEKAIIRKICRYRKRYAIYVGQFQRFGYSGAKLLLVYFDKQNLGLPFLIKLSDIIDIKKEYEAIDKMRDLIEDCRLEEYRIFEYKELGALLYMHRGTDQPANAEHPLSLSEVIYKKNTTFVDDNEIEKVINEVYTRMKNAHSKLKTCHVKTREHYKRYFRMNEALPRLKSILGENQDKGLFNFESAKVYNPIKAFNELPDCIKTNTACIHGDLHPDNIILNRIRTPRLIDFAWAKEDCDVFLDYVLIENSLRFKDFPAEANLKEQLSVDQLLLKEMGWSEVKKINFSNSKIKEIYVRLSGVIGAIRKKAHELLGEKFLMNNYLFTQFIVLYGLMRYEDYHPYITTRALGLIALKMKEAGMLKKN